MLKCKGADLVRRCQFGTHADAGEESRVLLWLSAGGSVIDLGDG
jgi:hypothetical protein